MITGPTLEDMLDDLIGEYCENSEDYYEALAEVVQALENKAVALKTEIAENAETEDDDDDPAYDPENDDVKDM